MKRSMLLVLAAKPGFRELRRTTPLIATWDDIDFAEIERLVFISGDTHYAELSRLDTRTAYPLYDLTFSGLTEVWPVFGPNRNRIAQAPLQPNFGRLTIDWSGPSPAVLMEVQLLDGSVAISRSVPFSELMQGR